MQKCCLFGKLWSYHTLESMCGHLMGRQQSHKVLFPTAPSDANGSLCIKPPVGRALLIRVSHVEVSNQGALHGHKRMETPKMLWISDSIDFLWTSIASSGGQAPPLTTADWQSSALLLGRARLHEEEENYGEKRDFLGSRTHVDIRKMIIFILTILEEVPIYIFSFHEILQLKWAIHTCNASTCIPRGNVDLQSHMLCV